MQNALRLNDSNFSTDCVDKNFVLNGKYQTLRLWHFPWRLLILRRYLLEHGPADVLKVSAGSNARAVTYHALLGRVGSLFARAYNKAEEQERTISVTFDGLREEKIFCPHISSKIRYRSSEARLANFRCLLSDKKFF